MGVADDVGDNEDDDDVNKGVEDVDKDTDDWDNKDVWGIWARA